uniref:(northern house mosquito) hypothetical protein n=1 Tax=Culex pipiens TaxID=7175 RepID=A0A8D8D3A1_CULPI
MCTRSTRTTRTTRWGRTWRSRTSTCRMMIRSIRICEPSFYSPRCSYRTTPSGTTTQPVSMKTTGRIDHVPLLVTKILALGSSCRSSSSTREDAMFGASLEDSTRLTYTIRIWRSRFSTKPIPTRRSLRRFC